ncbi:MAG TPA: SpoIIE family protein phosphatase [Verrucomicrobiae bacterium]|nr:SpoIIE family protein phosphatase [Verrucomicrobiae bacterium]
MHFLFRSHESDPPPVAEPVPTVFPKIQGADVGAVFVGKRVAGDFYDSLRVSPERVLFGLLDVAGRREDTRGILIAAQQLFRNLGADLFSKSDINESDAMTELCLRLNHEVIQVSSGVHSCPAFIACYHERFGTLCYTNAGHTPGLLRDGQGITELTSTGLPLGLFSHATCDSPTIGLEKGSVLLLVSRGVAACGSDGNEAADAFGLERVKQLLHDSTATGAQTLCTSILDAVDHFGGKSPLCDDRTALAFLRTT